MKNKTDSKRLARIAFFTALAAQIIPCCYALYIIAVPTVYRVPFIDEFRALILILSLLGIFLGALALIRHTGSKTGAIAAILLGLAAVIWHIALCGTDPLDNAPFCIMTWGVMYP
jgi:hypothetical protein